MNTSSCVSCISWFRFPEVCHVGQRIAKALFADNGPLTPADRRTFRNEIEEAVCAYVLKPDNVCLNAWSDGEREYDSLAVIEISLRKTGKAERIAELFHRTMPYPLLLILNHERLERHETEEKNTNLCSLVPIRGSEVMFSMAEKRISRDGREQVVIERMINTPWRQVADLEEFYAEADYAKFRKNTFRDLYIYYMNLLEALNCAVITGTLQVSGIDPAVRRRGLEELHRLELELAAIKAQAKKETELSKLVELNLQAKKIDHERHEIHERLKENHK